MDFKVTLGIALKRRFIAHIFRAIIKGGDKKLDEILGIKEEKCSKDDHVSTT